MKILNNCIIVTVVFLLFGCSESWNDEALLHDGRSIKVKRNSKYEFFSELGLYKTINQHSIEAINPSTNKTIKWSGDSSIEPIMLDFVNGTAYLVINGNEQTLVTRPLLYGCPSIPYVFLKLDERHMEWFPVQAKDVPIELKLANLSMNVDRGYFKEEGWQDLPKGKTLDYFRERGAQPNYDNYNKSIKTIQRWNHEKERSSYFQVNIPRSLEDWNYEYKDKQASRRFKQFNDCRPNLIVDPQLIEEGKLNANAGRDIAPIRAKIQSTKTTRELITHEMYSQQRGHWNSVGYLAESCKGIVERIEKIFYSSDEGYQVKEKYSGYAIVLSNTDGTARKIQLQQINQTHLDTVSCDKSSIYAVSRVGQDGLTVHRFNHSGNLHDAFPVTLLDTEKAIQGTDWGILWNIIPNNGRLEISLVDFEKNDTITSEGSINRKTNYSITLPAN